MLYAIMLNEKNAFQTFENAIKRIWNVDTMHLYSRKFFEPADPIFQLLSDWLSQRSESSSRLLESRGVPLESVELGFSSLPESAEARGEAVRSKATMTQSGAGTSALFLFTMMEPEHAFTILRFVTTARSVVRITGASSSAALCMSKDKLLLPCLPAGSLEDSQKAMQSKPIKPRSQRCCSPKGSEKTLSPL
jgi:hypothetical protein